MERISNSISLIGIIINEPVKVVDSVFFCINVQNEIIKIRCGESIGKIAMKYLKVNSNIAIQGYFKNNEVCVNDLLLLDIKK